MAETLSNGINNLPYVKLSLGNSSCDVYLFGCTVTSWIFEGQEKLYLSPLAPFDGSKAIRGGIPIVFPAFGQPATIPTDISSSEFIPNPMSQHGFARTAVWTFESLDVAADNSNVTAVFSFSQNEQTLKLWPHAFKLQYTVVLTRKGLSTALTVENPEGEGAGGFSFQALLHTYIRLPDGDSIQNLRVRGFYSHSYIDKLLPASAGQQQEGRHIVVIDREVDRIYRSSDGEGVGVAATNSSATSDIVRVSSAARRTSRGPAVGQTQPTDVVFWNPWTEKARAIADLPDDAFNRFVCVEPGLVTGWADLQPGDQLTLSQQLTI